MCIYIDTHTYINRDTYDTSHSVLFASDEDRCCVKVIEGSNGSLDQRENICLTLCRRFIVTWL